jgi:hypothetical protein
VTWSYIRCFARYLCERRASTVGCDMVLHRAFRARHLAICVCFCFAASPARGCTLAGPRAGGGSQESEGKRNPTGEESEGKRDIEQNGWHTSPPQSVPSSVRRRRPSRERRPARSARRSGCRSRPPATRRPRGGEKKICRGHLSVSSPTRYCLEARKHPFQGGDEQ